MACACRYAVLCADRVSGRADQGAKTDTIQLCSERQQMRDSLTCKTRLKAQTGSPFGKEVCMSSQQTLDFKARHGIIP